MTKAPSIGDAAPPPKRANTCAVVVTFNPDTTVDERLATIRAQFGHLVLVDNHSTNEFAGRLPTLARRDDTTVIANATNLGIGAALNQGLRVAGEHGFLWAVTFDQDTVPHSEMLARYADIVVASGESAVLLGCNFVDANRGGATLRLPVAGPAAYVERTTVITSGTLLSLRCFARIGAFREDYFIDSIDHEYCLRARQHGYRVLISRAPLMTHTIGGDSRVPRWLGAVRVYNHSRQRKYYIARNVVVTVADYYRTEPRWCLKQCARLSAELLSIFVFEKEKPAKLGAFFAGLRDGLGHRMDRDPDRCATVV